MFFLRKSAIFWSLMRATAKRHGFLHIGAHCCQRCARPDGADSAHFHMHIGKIGQFFKVRVFCRTQVGFGVDSPHNTAGDLQNTPGTPAIHFPLAAAGSQSALYRGSSFNLFDFMLSVFLKCILSWILTFQSFV